MCTVPPVFTQSLGSKDAVQGEEFYFQCEATGTPLPSYQFYKVHFVILLRI